MGARHLEHSRTTGGRGRSSRTTIFGSSPARSASNIASRGWRPLLIATRVIGDEFHFGCRYRSWPRSSALLGEVGQTGPMQFENRRAYSPLA